jgi:hypothetical protein
MREQQQGRVWEVNERKGMVLATKTERNKLEWTGDRTGHSLDDGGRANPSPGRQNVSPSRLSSLVRMFHPTQARGDKWPENRIKNPHTHTHITS